MPPEIINDSFGKFEAEGIFTMEHLMLVKDRLTEHKLECMGLKSGPIGLIYREINLMPSNRTSVATASIVNSTHKSSFDDDDGSTMACGICTIQCHMC
jgi:hypothetical protein